MPRTILYSVAYKLVCTHSVAYIDCIVGLQNREAAESEGKMAGEGDDKVSKHIRCGIV